MLECCCLELSSCKLPFHYFMEDNFTAISAGYSAKAAFLDSNNRIAVYNSSNSNNSLSSENLRRSSASGLGFFSLFLKWLSHACSFNNDAKV